jgi:phage gp36-like protein
MGAYMSGDDGRKALSDDFDSLYVLPDAQPDLDADIAAVEALINSHCGRRYLVPITNATAVLFLKALAIDLFLERAWGRGAGDEIPKKVSTRADAARHVLADVSKGLVTIGGATALTEQPTGGAEAIVVAGNAPEFTRSQMEGY